jgi:hypothetical protein
LPSIITAAVLALFATTHPVRTASWKGGLTRRRAAGAHRRSSTVRHLHVMGSDDSVTTGADAPLIERAVELDALDTAVKRLAGARAASWSSRPRPDSARRCCWSSRAARA